MDVNKRRAELDEVPLQRADQTAWPRGVRTIGIEELDALGIDKENQLYWHGKPIETRRPLDLTRAQSVVAVLVAVFTAVAAIAGAAQGFTAYNDWACKVGWKSVACPLPGK